MDEDILNLMVAVELYIAVKLNPPNPFVKVFGKSTTTEEEAFRVLMECQEKIRPILGEIYKDDISRIDKEEELMQEVAQKEDIEEEQ